MCSDGDAVGSEELPETEANVPTVSAGARVASGFVTETLTCVAAIGSGLPSFVSIPLLGSLYASAISTRTAIDNGIRSLGPA